MITGLAILGILVGCRREAVESPPGGEGGATGSAEVGEATGVAGTGGDGQDAAAQADPPAPPPPDPPTKDPIKEVTEPLEEVGEVIAGEPAATPPPAAPPGGDDPEEGGIPVAKPVPDKPGFVISPYSGKWVDVRGFEPGKLVADPHKLDEDGDKQFFRVPEFPAEPGAPVEAEPAEAQPAEAQPE